MRKIITSFFILSGLIFAGSVSAAITPNDPFFNNQWYLAKIKADAAWNKVSDSPDAVIAVIDSGIQIDHPDLKDNIWHNRGEIPGDNIDNDGNGFIDDVYGWDFPNNINDPNPKFAEGWTEAGISHGTMIAGIIAATGNNGQGVAGVTWKAQIMALKALNDEGGGRVSDVIRAIDYAINNGADIINLSFVNFNYSEGLQEAIYRAHNAGVIIVAAAGNEQSGGEGYNIDKTKIYPACYDGKMIGENMVIGVAATDALDQKTRFSSYGFNCIDIAAPGISFFSTATNGNRPGADEDYNGYWSGTSMAAPLVSATLALIQQANPELNKRETVNILFATADNISRLNPDYLGQLGNGRLNVNRAVEMAKEKLYSRVSRLAVATTDGSKEVKVVAANGDFVYNLPVELSKFGPVFVAGDVDGDGEEEFIIAPKPGEEPRLRIYNRLGKLKISFIAWDREFRGGLNIALSDLDDNGQQEMIVVPASAGPGEARIYDSKGTLKKRFAVVGSAWRGGLNVAAGDLDGKGKPEIVVTFGVGQEPQVRLFTSEGKLLGIFLAYEKSFRGGVNVAVANLNGRKDKGRSEIIVAPGPGRDPQIKVFNNRARLQAQFLGFNKNWQEGVGLAAGDTNNDGLADIILSAYPGGTPHVRVFDIAGTLLESFYAFEEGFNHGIKAGIIKINN